MEFRADLPQPIDRSAIFPEASRRLVAGVAAEIENARAQLQVRPYSFRAECECPSDCLRDHENE